jgi:hypothetical protein
MERIGQQQKERGGPPSEAQIVAAVRATFDTNVYISPESQPWKRICQCASFRISKLLRDVPFTSFGGKTLLLLPWY